MLNWLRSLDPRLPRDVWLLQVGGVMNSFGNGVVLPFLVIYLHRVRGFGLGTAGLVVATSAAALVCAGVAAGPLVDRIGPRRVLAGGLMLQAVGFGLFPLVRVPWQAFLLIAIEGVGSAGFWPSQSTLIARLTPSDRRHAAFAQQRVTMNLGIGLGALVGGLIANDTQPGSFTLLFVLDALTFLAYVAVLAFVHDPGIAPGERTDVPASYRAVVRDRLFVSLWVLNFAFVTAGYSLFNLVPAFARDQAGVSGTEIGLFFFVNTLLIVVLQLPISHAIEGRRRMHALALMPLLWAVAWILVDLGGAFFETTAAFVVIAVALAIFGVGECFHGPAHQSLVAEIAPGHLRGRYMSAHSLSWGLAGAVGPAAGGFILAGAPFLLWPLAAGVCLCAAVGAVALEPRVPHSLRRIPKQRDEPEAPVLDVAAA
jgi:MFS family permease